MLKHKLVFMLGMACLAGTMASAAPPTEAEKVQILQSSGAIDHLFAHSSVWNASKTGTTPGFVVDPGWPQVLPHHWILGQVGGVYVDKHDHVWVYQRPRSLTNDEAGLMGPVAGATNDRGQPINALGQPRPNGPITDCCNIAPSVLEFDMSGKLLRSWGGPGDAGYVGGAKCKASDGCIWPNSEHGLYVDQNDNIWLAGNSAPIAANKRVPADTNLAGGDGFVEKFDMDGNFKMRVGGTPTGPDSNNKNGGINGTPLLYLPTDMVRDPATNRMYISDGYGNRHVLIINADTGRYIGHFGAYGNNPVDDAAARAAGPWMNDYNKGNMKPAFFRNPVHCVTLANDGKLYMCDRGNNRIQVYDTHDPSLGQPCSNPDGQAGKCGYLAERQISIHTGIIGTAVTMNLSTDKAQSCLYVGDNANMTVYILNRSNLQELGRLGRSSRYAGDFHWVHMVGIDSKGDLYVGEVDTGKRVQKFIRYGDLGCSGTGSTTVGGPVGG